MKQGRLDICIIDEKLATLSDDQLIIFDMANLNETIGSMRTSQDINECTIKVMLDTKLEQAQAARQEQLADRGVVQDRCGTEEVEEEAEWIKAYLSDILNSHDTPLRVTAHSKG